MARAATSPELALFRTPGQWSKIRAAVYTPTTIYTARINGTFSTLDKVLEFEFDGGSGTLADVLPGMTAFIGSTAGAWDKGIVRVRNIDSNTLFIGETSDVNFADNDYITIVDDFGLWAKPVYISAGVIYMDGGTAYSDQHTNYLPLIRGGPTARVVKKTGATVSLSFDFPATIPSSSASSRTTSAPGSTGITGGTTQTPSVTWNSVGWKKIYHTVTAANGKSSFIVRYVFVWDSTNEPEPIELLSNPRGDVDSGGWEVSLRLYDEASLSQVRDHALIVLFTEDHYGDTAQEIGPVTGSENLLFVGWIARESIDWQSEGGSVSFTAFGPHYWLQKIPAWPDGVEFTTGAPANWTQVKSLTVDLGVVHHFIQWRTTAPRIIDIFPTGDTRFSKEVSSLASNLWEQIREMAFDQIFARALCNALGQLHIEIHPQLIPGGSRAHPTVLTITEEDLEDVIEVERVTMDEASIVDLSGIYINANGKGTAYFSLSPGHAHSHYGSSVVLNRVLLSSQSQSNTLAGLYRAWMNNPFPSIPLRFSANNRLVDIAPLQKCLITIGAGDTIRGIAETLGLIPLTVEYVFDPATGYLHTEATFEGETFADLAVNGDIPGSGDVSIPPLPPLPPLPPIDVLIPGTTQEPEPDAVSSRVILHDANMGLLYTENFDEASPNWITINAGLSQAQYEDLNHIVITPTGGIYVARRGSSGTSPFIAFAPYVGGTFTVIEDPTTIAAHFPSVTSPSSFGVLGLGVDPLSGQVAYVIGANGSLGTTGRQIFIGSGTSFTGGVTFSSSDTHVAGDGGLTFGGGEWRFTPMAASTASMRFIVISADGSTIIRNVTISKQPDLDIVTFHVPISSTDEVIIPRFDDGGTNGMILRITQNGAVSGDFTTGIGPGGLNFEAPEDNHFATDPTGTLMMGTWDTGERGKSSDGGATWGGLPTLPAGGDYAYAYAGGAGVESRWIAARGIVRFSPDFGDTWENREGNITTIAPLPSIDIVKVIG